MGLSLGSLLIYRFETIEGMEVAAPTIAPPFNPLWKIPINGQVASYGGLSKGVSDTLATYFSFCTSIQMYGLIIPHADDKAPRLSVLMELDKPYLSVVEVGLEKAFLRFQKGPVTRLGYSWPRGTDTGTHATSTSVHMFSEGDKTYRFVCQPSLNEETGCIVQEWQGDVMVIDTALLYVDK